MDFSNEGTATELLTALMERKLRLMIKIFVKLVRLLSLCWGREENNPPGDEIPGEEGEYHDASYEDKPHPPSLGDRLREGQSEPDGLRHLLARLLEPVLGPEEGKHQSVGELTAMRLMGWKVRGGL